MTDELERRADVPGTGDVSRALERVSDADRERAADLVQAALGDGRLGLDEIDDRLGAVVAARTRGDLEAALVHLPGADTVLSATQPVTPGRRADEPVVIQASSAAVRRSGRWDVPSRLAVRAKASSVVLDFTEAALPGPEVHVTVDASSSSLRLVVPADVQVVADDIDQHASAVTVRPPRNPRPPRVVITITGTIRTSSITATGPGWFRRRALRKAARRSS